eukprot:762679-Hanusia_phi.AAC.4
MAIRYFGDSKLNRCRPGWGSEVDEQRFDAGSRKGAEKRLSLQSFSDDFMQVHMMSPRYGQYALLPFPLSYVLPAPPLPLRHLPRPSSSPALTSAGRYLRSEMFSPRMIERAWTVEERQVQAGKEGSVGVGLVLEQKGSQLLVHGFVRGSASFNCGALERGDILHKVDEVVIDGMPRSQIAILIIGRIGTEVKLTFLRQETAAIMEKSAGDQDDNDGYGFHPLVLLPGSPGVFSHRMRRVAPRYRRWRRGSNGPVVC